ncbi:hypothetical protein HDU86_002111 [Geranomyces michiganensis]|nr:hypothetical protein HDU86_002111 [Geranomyces michiganensis]
MLATTEIPEEQIAPVSTELKAKDGVAAAQPVADDDIADNAEESSDDDKAMDVDAPLEEFGEEDMAEIDASNIVPARTRGVKIDFASMPELMAADDDDEDDEDAVVESAMEED